jgi:biopolymer transport protein ExbD
MANGDQTILSLGAKKFSDDDSGRRALADAIAQRIRRDPTLPVDIRADRSLRYDKVEPALRAIAQAASQAGAQGVTIRVCALEQQSAIHEQKEKHE